MFLPAAPKGEGDGVWDSIHVFEVIDKGRNALYKQTTTVILRLATSSESLGQMDLSGNMTRQVEEEHQVVNDGSHIMTIGKMTEALELKMRNMLSEIYFGKTKDVVGDLRSESCSTETDPFKH